MPTATVTLSDMVKLLESPVSDRLLRVAAKSLSYDPSVDENDKREALQTGLVAAFATLRAFMVLLGKCEPGVIQQALIKRIESNPELKRQFRETPVTDFVRDTLSDSESRQAFQLAYDAGLYRRTVVRGFLDSGEEKEKAAPNSWRGVDPLTDPGRWFLADSPEDAVIKLLHCQINRGRRRGILFGRQVTEPKDQGDSGASPSSETSSSPKEKKPQVVRRDYRDESLQQLSLDVAGDGEFTESVLDEVIRELLTKLLEEGLLRQRNHLYLMILSKYIQLLLKEINDASKNLLSIDELVSLSYAIQVYCGWEKLMIGAEPPRSKYDSLLENALGFNAALLSETPQSKWSRCDSLEVEFFVDEHQRYALWLAVWIMAHGFGMARLPEAQQYVRANLPSLPLLDQKSKPNPAEWGENSIGNKASGQLLGEYWCGSWVLHRATLAEPVDFDNFVKASPLKVYPGLAKRNLRKFMQKMGFEWVEM